ncbi:u-box domain protein [Sarocladium strictum]
MARLKLSLWAAVISDCQFALNLAPSSMKAHYYLSQAQLAMGDYDGALTSALAAHAICAETNDRSLPAVTGMVLKAKKERWEEIERRRLREDKVLEEEVVDGLRRELYRELEGVEGEVARQEVGEEWEGKMRRVREVFERARSQGEKRREVPDWAIDDISFGIMVDPVVTKTGKSYERASIMEHLRRNPENPNDPMTRERLLPSDLRPNLALKQACEEFLNENGWAVDW